MSKTSVTVDVTIIGYGPVGKLLAVDLARKGHAVAVVERYTGLFPLPRATHCDFETMRLFDALGVGEEVRSISLEKGGPDVLPEFKAADLSVLCRLGDPAPTRGGWWQLNCYHQPKMETMFHELLLAEPKVRLFRGWQAVAIDQTADAARVTCKAVSTGETVEIQSAFVVGCDGANSFVRETMDPPITNTGFEYYWLVVDLLRKAPYEGRQEFGHILDPVRPITFIALGRWRYRFEFMLVGDETVDQMNTPEVTWELVGRFGFNTDNAELERNSVYAFRALWADQWRKGRLLLAGDSAHLMPPFLGQGLCSGIRDVAALAWRLDGVLAGRYDEAILDSYGPERIPHVRSLVETAVEHGRIICVTDPAAALVRDQKFRDGDQDMIGRMVPHPRLGPGLSVDGDPAAGYVGPHGLVEVAGKTGLFDRLVGRGFILVSDQFDPGAALSDDNRRFLREIGGATAFVHPDAAIKPCDDSYASWFAEHGCAAVLYRPDFHVFGGAGTPAEANALVDRLRAALPLAPEALNAGSR